MRVVMILETLNKNNKLQLPKWLITNTVYLTKMGSVAYGVSSNNSDIDVYGFCVPPKNIIFPHTAGIIYKFGDQGEQFDQWQQHHVDWNAKQYDFQVFSIIKYFNLCAENNPNALDSLFTRRASVIHSTPLSEHLRSQRTSFLHKGSYHKLRGYAYSQLSKIKNKVNSSNPKRAADIEEHGYDTKFAYHVVRLVLQAHQILVEHDLDIMRNAEILNSVRRGEWSLERLENWFDNQEKVMDQLYASSTLRHKPDYGVIKKLLVDCLEIHFGSLDMIIGREVIADNNISAAMLEIKTILKRYSII